MNAATPTQEETHIMASLLIAHVINPTDGNEQKVLAFAHSSSSPNSLLRFAESRIRQYKERDPMLWFRLLRSTRSKEYDIMTLGKLGIMNLDVSSSVLAELNGKIIATSPFPDATWIMDENHIGKEKEKKGTKKGVKTVLYGNPSLAGLSIKAGQGNRAFSIISNEIVPERILFTCTVPIK